MEHGYARVILASFVLLGWLCFCGVSAGAVDAAAGQARSQPTQGQKINPVVAEYYETGISPNKTRAASEKKGKNKSPNREDIFDYVETYAVDDPSSSGSGYGSNELDLNPALFLPPLAPAGPKLYPRPAPLQPDYVYKFKFYPAVGYHPNAKIIYLDDHDYYHPYYTPSGYESLKTVKKSVSKIQKELKKATKYQPHYDHLYGKGRAKQYLVSKPPPNWGPPPSYGHGKRPYHQPHPVTAFHGAGHIDDYLSYGENVDFDRDGKDVEDE